MTKTQLPRTGVSQWSADSDTWPGRTGWDTELSNLNAVMAVSSQGTNAARPVAAYSGRYYWATDTQRLWYDTGTTWVECSPVGGGGTPTSNDVGDAGAEGSSRIAARADHQHALLAPGMDPVAMSYSGVAMSRGSSATVARADHAHALPAMPLSASTPAAVSDTAGTVGVSTNVARADHVHARNAVWQACASGSTTTLGDGVARTIPFDTNNMAQSNGWGGFSAGLIVVPYNGIYIVAAKASTGGVAGTGTICTVSLRCNSGQPVETQVNWTPDAGRSTGYLTTVPWQFSAGEGIGVAVSGIFGGIITWNVWMTVALMQRM